MAGKKTSKAAKARGRVNGRPRSTQDAYVGQGSGAVQSSIEPWHESIKPSVTVKSTAQNGDTVLVGRELVGQTQMGNPGDIAFILDMSPAQWVGTRAQSYARMFESFFIQSATMTVVPVCPSTTTGLSFAYFDKDPLDAPVTSLTSFGSLSKLMSQQGATVAPAWKPLVTNFRLTQDEKKTYFSAPILGEGDIRNCQQGIGYVYSTGVPSQVNGALVMLSYTIKFLSPCAVTVPAVAPTGWVPSQLSGGPYTSTTAFFSPGVTPQGNNFVIGSPSGTILELLSSQSFIVTIANAVTTVAAYTPLFMRAVGATYRLYTSVEAASAGNLDEALYGAPNNVVNLNAWVWLKLLTNVINV